MSGNLLCLDLIIFSFFQLKVAKDRKKGDKIVNDRSVYFLIICTITITIYCYCYSYINIYIDNNEVSVGSSLIICTITIFYPGGPFSRIIWSNNLESCLGT